MYHLKLCSQQEKIQNTKIVIEEMFQDIGASKDIKIKEIDTKKKKKRRLCQADC
jgi:hypothetical protein